MKQGEWEITDKRIGPRAPYFLHEYVALQRQATEEMKKMGFTEDEVATILRGYDGAAREALDAPAFWRYMVACAKVGGFPIQGGGGRQ